MKVFILSTAFLCIAKVTCEDCQQLSDSSTYRVRDSSNDNQCLSCVEFKFVKYDVLKYYCRSDEINTDFLYTFYSRNSHHWASPYSHIINQIWLKLQSQRNSTFPAVVLAPREETLPWKWDSLRILDLSSNHISEVSQRYFENFPRLLQLILANNSITSISENNFSPLINLQTLNLSRNSIKDIAANAFRPQVNLFVIDLGFNQISHLSNDIFSSQLHLEVVLLNNNQMLNFDIPFRNISSSLLPSIDLSYNKIKAVRLDGHFLNISFSHNELTNFAINLTSSMLSLNLSHNSIKEISNYSFIKANNLRVLDVKHNLLSTLPTSSFRKLKLMEYVDISQNFFHRSLYETTDNWMSFFLHFEHLKYVALDDNTWTCSDLKDILNALKLRSIKIMPGNEHTKSNIFGIRCIDIANNNGTKGSNTFPDISENIMQRVRNEIGKSMGNYSLLQNNISTLFSKLDQIEKKGLQNLPGQVTNLEAKLNKMYLQKAIDKTDGSSKELVDRINTIIETKFLNVKKEITENNPKGDVEHFLPNAEAKNLLQNISDETSAKSGEIINNILLFSLLCCLLFFIYAYYKKPNTSVREEINLV